MVSIARKRAKVKKKKKIVKRAATKKRVKKKKVSKKTAKKIPAKRKVKKASKSVRKVSKKKAKKRARAKKKKRGELRDWTDRILESPQATAQILERLQTKLPGIFLPGMVETDESMMMQRLIRAEQLGAFDETARQLAMDFDWNLRDVYELWHSPDVYF